MKAPPAKSESAFRTIGEVSRETGLPQHVLRYWETRFPQLKPLTRAGNRRYYRTEDVALVRRIDAMLNAQGYTVRGVQQVLTGEQEQDAFATTPGTMETLRAIRDLLAAALAEDQQPGSAQQQR